jgi:hypothetical protein
LLQADHQAGDDDQGQQSPADGGEAAAPGALGVGGVGPEGVPNVDGVPSPASSWSWTW